MKKTSKRILVFMLMLIFALSTISGAYALDNEKPVRADLPEGEVSPLASIKAKDVNQDNEKYIEDNLQKGDISPLEEVDNKGVSPNVIGPIVPVTYDVYNTYTGYNWRDWQASYGPGGVANFSRTLSVSNTYNCSVSVDKDALSAAVGFNVTASSSKTANYSHNINSGKYGWIGYADWYNVKEFNKKSGGIIVGNGWAKQWLRWSFHYAENNSPSKPPAKPAM